MNILFFPVVSSHSILSSEAFSFLLPLSWCSMLSSLLKGRSVDRVDRRQRLRRLQNAVCIMLLMGLTWAVGYLNLIYKASEVVQGIFTVLNSMQGYFIFMLYCVRQPTVRKLWREQFACLLPKRMHEQSSKITSSTSGAENTRSRNDAAKRRANKPRQKAAPLNSSSSGFNPFQSNSDGFSPNSVVRSPPERVPRTSAGALDNYGAQLDKEGFSE